jgi:hypothetical protein
LGESVINKDTLRVAKIDTSSGKIIRAYGTQPHPNVLSGLLGLAIILGITLLNTGDSSKLFHVEQFRGILIVVLFLITLAISFSFSKINLLILFLLLFGGFIFSKKKIIMFFLIALLLGSIFLGIEKTKSHFNPSSKTFKENISLRKKYSDNAIKIIKQNPFIGTGLGGFCLEGSFLKENYLTPWYIQPVHNIYLLIFSESGIFIFLFFIFYFFKKIKSFFILNSNSKLFFINYLILFLLFSGIFDHYLYTLSQGNFIFSFGLIAFFNLSKLFHVEQFAQIKK